MFDFLVLLVVGLSTAFAALRGGLRELSTLIALAIAGGMTFLLAEPILNATGQAGSFFGAIIIIAILVAAFFIIAHIGLHLGLKQMPLEGRAKLADRMIGGGFGLLRGLVLIGLGYLGYSYYLDEAQQPDSVRNAITQPVAAGMAKWFQSFTPDDAYIENAAPADRDKDDTADAAQDGYDRIDRNGLTEIVTTVTTTGGTTVEDQADVTRTLDNIEADDIADLIEQEEGQ
jgi:membrane protein required for colicin V production